MKTYIVYVNGIETRYIKSTTHSKAEEKARRLYPHIKPFQVSVVYTEL